jgi:hypothetical protein
MAEPTEVVEGEAVLLAVLLDAPRLLVGELVLDPVPPRLDAGNGV